MMIDSYQMKKTVSIEQPPDYRILEYKNFRTRKKVIIEHQQDYRKIPKEI